MTEIEKIVTRLEMRAGRYLGFVHHESAGGLGVVIEEEAKLIDRACREWLGHRFPETTPDTPQPTRS